MGLSTVLNAKTRQVKSSNYANRLRAEGLLPAIFYGQGLEKAQSVSLDYKEFKTALLGSEGNRSLYSLKIDDQPPQPVLLKEYQLDPLSRKVIHADFCKVDPAKPVTVRVPVQLSGKPVGVEKGGQLQLGIREIMISTLPENAPSELVVDVSGLNLGQSMHLSQIPLPENFKISYTADLPVATIAIPKGLKAEAGAEAEAEAN